MSLPNLKKKVPQYKLTLPSNGREVKYRPFLQSDKELLLIAKTSEDDEQILDAIEQIVEFNVEYSSQEEKRNATRDKLKKLEQEKRKKEQERNKQLIDSIDTVVPVCVEEQDFDHKKLPYFDLEYLFLHIFGKSDGEKFEFTLICNDDSEYDNHGKLIKSGTKIDVTVNLEDVIVKKNPLHKNKIHLVDEIHVILKYPTINTYQKYKNSENIPYDDLLIECTEFIIDGEIVYDSIEYTKDELKEFYLGVTQKNWLDLINFFETMPVLYHEIKYINPNTGVEGSTVLRGINDFF